MSSVSLSGPGAAEAEKRYAGFLGGGDGAFRFSLMFSLMFSWCRFVSGCCEPFCGKDQPKQVSGSGSKGTVSAQEPPGSPELAAVGPRSSRGRR